MEIKNIRLGFATNSSSSHSVIIAGSHEPSLVENTNSEFNFGWERFLCETKEDKKKYFCAQLASTLGRSFNTRTVEIIVKGLFGIELPKGDNDYSKSYGVDHQSMWDAPMTFDGKPNLEFYEEFSNSIIDNPNLNILGGNDNEEFSDSKTIKYPEGYSWLKFITEKTNPPIAVKTNNGDWILFSKEYGTKITLNFKNKYQDITVTDAKSSYPELIDLKITDYCPIGCSYCYQNSTTKGLHASLGSLREIIPELYENKGLFEIAIGGGEPTMHPNFIEILEDIKNKGIVANFTTKSNIWLKDYSKASKILNLVGGFAYSIDDHYPIQEILQLYKAVITFEQHREIGKLNFQYIPEAHKLEYLEEIIEVLVKENFSGNLTLLGYKSNGRGGNRPFDHALIKELLRLRKKHNFWFKIGIDTVLAKRFEKELKEGNIPPNLYYTEEGKHSMYIDAVEWKYGSSSFTEKYYPLDDKSYNCQIDKYFKTVNIE